ncbi:DNA-binding transcriptional MerR regulator [Nocardiopsis sp. Huas11]|uniref:MerR family DNA-binding transcriptional regulator n=1 Tax=Nocardiopsis sp. Huas11 TaxID=2183912 RepID=UPI000EB1654F|nr:MerR family DNA-binding transcriptional regulator [Nocardiopsis sp. Huas11]RKS09632.1 DNA-binding transcriptional MerR regulator [Nocardiopsis sp. Huas11]
MRPIDLAREHGLSAQAVRNYEDEGILPPAERGANGYRRYTPVHAQALRAFLALREGFGHGTAARVMRAAGRDDEADLFRLLDQAHADLLQERRTLDEVTTALGALTEDPRPHSGGVTIGALAHRLGMHPASLRKWERAGILRPVRDPATGYRLYPPDVVRDAHAAEQLRRGGYGLARIADFVARLRSAGGGDALDDLLRQWRARIARRSRAMLAAGSPLDEYLALPARLRSELGTRA